LSAGVAFDLEFRATTCRGRLVALLCSLDALPTSLTLRDRLIDERHFMSNTQAAVVLGSSGSVGNALIKELIRNGSFKPIVTLVRRSQPDQVAARKPCSRSATCSLSTCASSR
jgi:hypothetical protein